MAHKISLAGIKQKICIEENLFIMPIRPTQSDLPGLKTKTTEKYKGE